MSKQSSSSSSSAVPSLDMPSLDMPSRQPKAADRTLLAPPELPLVAEASLETPELPRISIAVAFAEPVGYDGSRQVALMLHGERASTLNRLYHGLKNAHAVKADGDHVDNHSDVIRYLLDEIAASQLMRARCL